MAHTSEQALLAVISFASQVCIAELVDASRSWPALLAKACLTCNDTRTLKFTLIIQAMPNSGVA